jgi:hypothetical protein
MGANLGSRALAQSLPCAATTLSLSSPLSLSGHMQDATTAASRLVGAHLVQKEQVTSDSGAGERHASQILRLENRMSTPPKQPDVA